jgi:hypothetical protein
MYMDIGRAGDRTEVFFLNLQSKSSPLHSSSPSPAAFLASVVRFVLALVLLVLLVQIVLLQYY